MSGPYGFGLRFGDQNFAGRLGYNAHPAQRDEESGEPPTKKRRIENTKSIFERTFKDFPKLLIPFLCRGSLVAFSQCSKESLKYVQQHAELDIKRYLDSLKPFFPSKRNKEFANKINKLKAFIKENAGRNDKLPKKVEARINFKLKTFLFVAPTSEREFILNNEICPLLLNSVEKDVALKAIPAIVMKLFNWSKPVFTLEHVGPSLKGNKEVVNKAIQKIGISQLQFAAQGLRQDKTFLLELVRNDIESAKHFDANLLDNQELALELIRIDYRVFQFLSANLKVDYSFALKAASINGFTLVYIEENFERYDANQKIKLLEKAYQQNIDALSYAPIEYLMNHDFMKMALTYNYRAIRYCQVTDPKFIIEFAKNLSRKRVSLTEAFDLKRTVPLAQFNEPFAYIRDQTFFITCIVEFPKQRLGDFPPELVSDYFKSNTGFIVNLGRAFSRPFSYASENLRNTKWLVYQIFQYDPEMIRLADASVIKPGYLLGLLKDRPAYFKYMRRYLHNKRFLFDALQTSNVLLSYIPNEYNEPINSNFYRAARRFYSMLIEFDHRLFGIAPKTFKKDKSFVVEACRINGLALAYADKSFLESYTCIEAALDNNKNAVCIIPEERLLDKNFVGKFGSKYRKIIYDYLDILTRRR